MENRGRWCALVLLMSLVPVHARGETPPIPDWTPAEARSQDLAMFRPYLYLNRSYSFGNRSRAEARP